MALQYTLERIRSQRSVETEVFIRENSEDNILYTRAVNEGLRRFAYSDRYDYVLVLNQDACLHDDALARMASAMQSHPRAGLCAPVTLSRDGRVNWSGSADAFPWGMHIIYPRKQLPAAPFNTYWINGH